MARWTSTPSAPIRSRSATNSTSGCPTPSTRARTKCWWNSDGASSHRWRSRWRSGWAKFAALRSPRNAGEGRPGPCPAAVKALAAAVLAVAVAALLVRPAPGRRVVQLPAGVVDVRAAMHLGSDVEVYGSPGGTVLRMTSPFPDAALADCGDNVYL